jgi:hypothetical protein
MQHLASTVSTIGVRNVPLWFIMSIKKSERPLPTPEECRRKASALRMSARLTANSEIADRARKMADQWDHMALELEADSLDTRAGR